MKSRNILRPFLLVVVLLSLVACNESDEFLTVSKVWQEATALDGKRIRVRGLGALRYEPIHPLQIGGCSVVPSANSPVKGIGMLFEESLNNQPRREILISESSLICQGDTCSVTCRPFKPPADTRTLALESASPRIYELVGTLRINSQEGEVVLILDDIDMETSGWLVDEKWEPLPTGEFTQIFP